MGSVMLSPLVVGHATVVRTVAQHRSIATIFGLAALYVIIARLSLLVAMGETNVSPVWPPSGLGLPALLLIGPYVWPGIWVGATSANLWGFLENFSDDHEKSLAGIVLASCSIGA